MMELNKASQEEACRGKPISFLTGFYSAVFSLASVHRFGGLCKNPQFDLFGLEFNQSFVVGTLALSLYTGAYIAEAIRAGLLIVPPGQSEAARSLGLSLIQTLRYVILPQAIRLVIPPLGNIYIAMIKNSAILSSIALVDLMSRATYVNNRIDRTLEVFAAVIIFYFILTLPLAWFVSYFEKKLNPYRATTLKLRGAR